jgi:hypothetical protein
MRSHVKWAAAVSTAAQLIGGSALAGEGGMANELQPHLVPLFVAVTSFVEGHDIV